MNNEQLIQTLEETITLIANEANPFDYSSVHYPICDTPGCIAGWVAYIAVSKGDATIDESGMFAFDNNDCGSPISLATEYLGLSEDEGHRLFYCLFTYTGKNNDPDANPTRAEAIAYIKRFIRYIERGRKPEDLEVFADAQVQFD